MPFCEGKLPVVVLGSVVEADRRHDLVGLAGMVKCRNRIHPSADKCHDIHNSPAFIKGNRIGPLQKLQTFGAMATRF